METLFIDLHVHTLHSQERRASLPVKDTLEYYQKLGERKGKRVIIRINDHDTITGGVEAMEEFLNHREKYPNLFVIPGMECNVSLNYVLAYKKPNYIPDPNYPDTDDQYKFIFKTAHVGVAPCLKDINGYKKWKSNKDLIVYSLLAKMNVDLSQDNGVYYLGNQIKNIRYADRDRLTNLGHQLIAIKNLIRKKYGVTIPYSTYYSCIQEGRKYKEIMHDFFEISVDYLQSHYDLFKSRSHDNVANSVKIMLAQELNATSKRFSKLSVNQIVRLFDNYPDSLLSKDKQNLHIQTGGLKRINFDELCDIIHDVGGFVDIDHPDLVFGMHTNAEIPTEFLKDIDFSVLYQQEYNNVTNLINSSAEVDLTRVLGGETLSKDRTGLIKLQILRKAMNQNGYKLTNDMLGCEIPKKILKNTFYLEKIIDIMEKNRVIPSIGYDKHMNHVDKLMMISKDKRVMKTPEGRLEVIDEKYAFDYYNKVKNTLELDKSFDKFMIDDDKAQNVTVKDFDNMTDHFYTTQYDHVTQSAYCDAILGKEIDFKTSSMFTLKLGRILVDNDDVDCTPNLTEFME